jgi:hypothetical protein
MYLFDVFLNAFLLFPNLLWIAEFNPFNPTNTYPPNKLFSVWEPGQVAYKGQVGFMYMLLIDLPHIAIYILYECVINRVALIILN